MLETEVNLVCKLTYNSYCHISIISFKMTETNVLNLKTGNELPELLEIGDKYK